MDHRDTTCAESQNCGSIFFVFSRSQKVNGHECALIKNVHVWKLGINKTCDMKLVTCWNTCKSIRFSSKDFISFKNGRPNTGYHFQNYQESKSWTIHHKHAGKAITTQNSSDASKLFLTQRWPLQNLEKRTHSNFPGFIPLQVSLPSLSNFRKTCKRWIHLKSKSHLHKYK